MGRVVAEQAVLVAAARLMRCLGMARQRLDSGKGLRPILVQRVEGAGSNQALDQALVDHALVQPLGKVEQILEGAVLDALLGEPAHGFAAHALDGCERIPDRLLAIGVPLHHELGRGPVHVGRQELDADLLEVAPVAVQLFDVAHIERHGRGEELDRMVGLEVGRLVADQRIGGGVALVEAVACELVDLVEDRRSLVLLDAVLLCALDEARALRVHLRLDLLAHGAAQQVGAAERIAAQHLRDLHDLLLVDHDTVGFLQDSFQQGMKVVWFFLAVLALDVARNVFHRTGPIERHHGDDVLEAVRLHLAQHVAHAVAFKLEHTGAISPGQQLETLTIVERQLGDIDLVATDEVAGLLDHRQRLEAEEVELHEPRRLDPLHVELGGWQRLPAVGIAIKRHQRVEWPVADHDTGGMSRCIAVEAFEL